MDVLIAQIEDLRARAEIIKYLDEDGNDKLDAKSMAYNGHFGTPTEQAFMTELVEEYLLLQKIKIRCGVKII